MESRGTLQNNQLEPVESLYNIFNGEVSRDIIGAVLDNVGGELNLAIDAIMRFTSDDTVAESTTDNTVQDSISNERNFPSTQTPVENEVINTQDQSAIISTPCSNMPHSYAATFQNTGAMPKQRVQPTSIANYKEVKGWNEQIRKIIHYHNKGYRTLILLRGAPGSGKTYLAHKIIDMTIGNDFTFYKTHICSADDFFMYRGQYCFNKHQLSEAHRWNLNRARLAMEQGISPVIIDNTNIEAWEMEPYVRIGVTNGYFIETVVPDTPWARKANQLSQKNVHNVPITSIKKMLDNFQHGITGTSILKIFELSYPSNRVPPIIRSMPIFQAEETNLSVVQVQEQESAVSIIEPAENIVENKDVTKEMLENSNASSTIQIDENIVESKDNMKEISNNSAESITFQNDGSNNVENLGTYEVIQKQLEEFAKFEQEWENGEDWINGESAQEVRGNSNENVISDIPKPPRGNNSQKISHLTSNIFKNVNNCEDWTQISMFMPSWTDVTPSTSAVDAPTKFIETITSSTCMEIGDTDTHRNNFKVLTATPRDINTFHMSFNIEKIPGKLMLDKSSMTNDNVITESAKRCKHEEKHFKELRKMFKNVSKQSLRDIFESCMGDVNWAVSIVIDGMETNQLQKVDEGEVSEDEVDDVSSDDLCSCLAAYNVCPDSYQGPDAVLNLANTTTVVENVSMPQAQRKIKKSNNLSEDSLFLKKQLEKNFGFSDSHYSDHTLKIRKFRRGETEFDEERVVDITSNAEETSDIGPGNVETGYQDTASCLPNSPPSDDEAVNFDEDKTVNVNVGRDFITSLDTLFGRPNMTYPDKVLPKINIPESLLRELNALWMESLMFQLDEHDKQTAIMLQEDEDFARKLAMKEEELTLTGKKPAVPDFREIMDTEFAISLYQKDLAEWRNKEPNDLAAKLTREKLYNLFPEVPKEVLSELLVAHDNKFQDTVEVLLISTGREDVLKKENGFNDFVVNKTVDSNSKELKQATKSLTEAEWPLLPNGEDIDMTVVDSYRSEAERHLTLRNQNHNKANEYVRRGMTPVASYFNDLAAFHKLKYEQANSLAAASLILINTARCPDNCTIDLHYLRVSEAREALDLFIDRHIQRLKEIQGRGRKSRYLFFITGRGLHSNGRPRLKPAMKKRLIERGLPCGERNPGLLSARINPGDRLSYEVP